MPVPYYDWAAGHAAIRPDALAQVDIQNGRSYTYAQMDERAARLGRWLQDRGVGRGDRVAILAYNGPEYFELEFAAGKTGDLDLSVPPSLAGGPPLLYGTWGKRVARAATEFAGWIGSALYRSDEQVIASLETYRTHGGNRAIISSIVMGAGDEKAQRARLDSFVEAGFDEAVVMLRPDGPKAEEVRRWVSPG